MRATIGELERKYLHTIFLIYPFSVFELSCTQFAKVFHHISEIPNEMYFLNLFYPLWDIAFVFILFLPYSQLNKIDNCQEDLVDIVLIVVQSKLVAYQMIYFLERVQSNSSSYLHLYLSWNNPLDACRNSIRFSLELHQVVYVSGTRANILCRLIILDLMNVKIVIINQYLLTSYG